MNNNVLDITAIVLTYNEHLHLGRCLERIVGVVRRVVVVDSFSTDDTCEIAARYGVEVVQHKWPGTQAQQFNWAMEHIEVTTPWILRLDADEYLQTELIEELRVKLPVAADDVSAFLIPLGRAFAGRLLRHGIVNGVKIIRLFRTGCAHYAPRLMDEHLTVTCGRVEQLEHKFVDDNLMGMREYLMKHLGYAQREAVMELNMRHNLSEALSAEQNVGAEVAQKRAEKSRYAQMPLFWRAWGYFVYRYVVKRGFLDGREGLMWDFFQGLWYRMLVDVYICEAERATGKDKERLIAYIRDNYNIKL